METRSTLNLTKQNFEGINLNELRTLAENNILIEKLDNPVWNKKKVYKKQLRKSLKQNKKAEKYYKKIEKLKAKLAKLRGITL